MTEPEKRWVETEACFMPPGYLDLADLRPEFRERVLARARELAAEYAPNPRRWHPSAADHHDRGEDCGEVECTRCMSPDDLA